MTVSGLVHIKLAGAPPRVEVTRGEGVDRDFWASLSAHFDSVPGRDSHRLLLVPLDRFLAGRLWLREQCRTYRVALDLDDSIRPILDRLRRDREDLAHILGSGQPLAENGRLISSLGGTRYIRQLRDFQRRDLSKLVRLAHGANFSVPGGGKTAVAYALYELERLRGRVARLLVVAPLSAFDAWETEARLCFSPTPSLARFGGRVPHQAEIVLVNYQKLSPFKEQLAGWLLEAPSHLILDEAHRAKAGRSGEWGSACLDLSHLAVRRDILTGTPAPQGPRDLLALVDFLWPHQSRRVLPADVLTSSPSAEAMQHASGALQPLFVRTRKEELGLDPPRLWVEMVELRALQLAIYSALRNRYAGLFDLDRKDRTTLAQMGEVTVYLLQAATNPALLARRLAEEGPAEYRFPLLEIPPGSKLAELIVRYSQHEIPPKFRKAATIVERNAANGRKTLLWSNFPQNLLALEQLLARFEPALIYGAIPMADGDALSEVRTREKELSRFRSDPGCFVLLANPAATAEGVSLHEVCHDAIYLDRTFNAGQYLQSVDRIHRLGLPKGTETQVSFLVTEGTIDEVVGDRVATKAERLSQMLNDPDLVAMALPDEEDFGQVIEESDLDSLFQHLRGHES